jgi:hypothetical protein
VGSAEPGQLNPVRRDDSATIAPALGTRDFNCGEDVVVGKDRPSRKIGVYRDPARWTSGSNSPRTILERRYRSVIPLPGGNTHEPAAREAVRRFGLGPA